MGWRDGLHLGSRGRPAAWPSQRILPGCRFVEGGGLLFRCRNDLLRGPWGDLRRHALLSVANRADGWDDVRGKGRGCRHETRFTFSVPAFGRTGPLSATWSCGLVVEIRAADGEVVQQNDLVVRIVYVAGGGAEAVPADVPSQ